MGVRGSKPGEHRGGRKKGTPNKLTKALKDVILGALDDAGGQAYLAKQAKTNPSAFLSLLGRVVPQELKAELDTKSTVIVVERTYCKPKQ
jgi:hypothetical protein